MGFSQCTSLTDVGSIDNVEELFWATFQECPFSYDISTVNKVRILGGSAFESPNIYGVVNMPNLTGSGDYKGRQFRGSKISKVENLGNFPEIQNYMFYNCSALESVNLPAHITSILGYAFENCSSLTEINLSNVTSIGNRAFQGCSALTEILNMNKVEILGNDCFLGCTKLSGDMNLPNLKTNGFSIFQDTAVTSASNLGTITTTDRIFKGCNQLKYATLPATITSVGKETFRSCLSLSHIKILAETPPSLDAMAFFETNSTFLIYVPDASVEAYKTATNWSAYADRIKGISEMPTE